jgi:hypothetical protein
LKEARDAIIISALLVGGALTFAWIAFLGWLALEALI